MDLTACIGVTAAALTTFANWPQLKKAWQTGKAGDLSLLAFCLLAAGVALWLLYGVLRSDVIIIGANAVSLTLLAGILFVKLREITAASRKNDEWPRRMWSFFSSDSQAR